jgi:hypothetical protein
LSFDEVEICITKILGWKLEWNLEAKILEITLKKHWILISKARSTNPKHWR